MLDRDCGIGGSFHLLDLEKFSVPCVISISSIPNWNADAAKMGVQTAVLKDFGDLEGFGQAVVKMIEKSELSRQKK